MKSMTFDVPTLARATGKSRQAIHKQIAKIARGEATTFHGASATAKLVRGRGGKNGFRYLLTFNQPVPVELDAALALHSTAFEGALKTDEKAVSQRNETYEIIAPLLSIKPYSSEMAEAVRSAAAATGKTENWIRGKLRAYRDEGLAGLGRKKRADTGERRVIVSRLYDKAALGAGVSRESIRATARSMDLYIAGLFKKGETYALVRRHAKRKLKELTRASGFDPGDAELDRICCVPDNVINRGMPLRSVHRFKADRRAYEDIKPRIRRTTAVLAPGDVLMADATKLDIAVAREDGSIYFPPCMLWMDLATRYVWVFLYFPDKGKGLANVHGIETFLSVVEELGCPKSIYADNGPEYNFTSFIDDAMKLVDDHGRPLMRFDLLGKSVRKSNTINSIPHNPQGKAPVEGWFGLWRHSLKGIQGYVGGDRTKMHTPNVGERQRSFRAHRSNCPPLLGKPLGFTIRRRNEVI